MPKVKKISGAIHPNSRKAMQMARQEHRDLKLDRRKVEANLKLKAILKKLNWFRNSVDKSKSVYTSEEVHELIERYLQRFSEEDKKLEEQRSMKGRRFQDRIGHEYKTKFAVERERQEYEANGIEWYNRMVKEPEMIMPHCHDEAARIGLDFFHLEGIYELEEVPNLTKQEAFKYFITMGK